LHIGRAVDGADFAVGICAIKQSKPVHFIRRGSSRQHQAGIKKPAKSRAYMRKSLKVASCFATCFYSHSMVAGGLVLTS
jgi:hypothetical protein